MTRVHQILVILGFLYTISLPVLFVMLWMVKLVDAMGRVLLC